MRLKEKIVTIESSLNKIKKIRGVRFEWKDKEKFNTRTNLGVIAQEIEASFPELVFIEDDEMQTKSVNYDGFIGVFIEAIKEQQQMIEMQKQALTQQQKQINKYDQQISQLVMLLQKTQEQTAILAQQIKTLGTPQTQTVALLK